MPKHNLLDFSHFQMLFPVFFKCRKVSTKLLFASESLSFKKLDLDLDWKYLELILCIVLRRRVQLSQCRHFNLLFVLRQKNTGKHVCPIVGDNRGVQKSSRKGKFLEAATNDFSILCSECNACSLHLNSDVAILICPRRISI